MLVPNTSCYGSAVACLHDVGHISALQVLGLQLQSNAVCQRLQDAAEQRPAVHGCILLNPFAAETRPPGRGR